MKRWRLCFCRKLLAYCTDEVGIADAMGKGGVAIYAPLGGDRQPLWDQRIWALKGGAYIGQSVLG